jgi:SAM-dependent methyltransferase
VGEAARRWAEDLASWAIPDEIMARAPADPWKLSPRLFTPAPRTEPADTSSRRRALEALPAGGSVLDVGAGAGAAGLALCPPARRLVSVDESEDMLAAVRANAAELGIEHEGVLGRWPDVAASVPVADVVVCHHVLYNVPDIVEFALALGAHARRRVVVEITERHPVASSNPLWEHFWGIDRPERPTADDAVAALVEAGIDVAVERERRPPRQPGDHPAMAEHVTRRLCLPPERQPEVEALLARQPPADRQVVTLWWSGSAG